MISIDFGGDEKRVNNEITTEWLVNALNKRGLNRNSICLYVTIEHEDILLSLATGSCPSRKGSPKSKFPRSSQHIIEMWNENGLNEQNFKTGQLISFLKWLFKFLDLKLK